MHLFTFFAVVRIFKTTFFLQQCCVVVLQVLFCELGGSVESSTCVGCGTKTLPLLLSDYTPEDMTLSSPRDSISSLPDEPTKNLWGCLEAYKDLLESQNVQLSVTIADHLFKIIPSTSTIVKRELLFKVFYPTFLNQKTKYFENDDDETSKFLMQCCLSVLSSQLCNVTFAEEFMIRSGLDHILQLITVADFSKSCCSILEVTVVIELWRLETRDDKSESPSLDMLTRALETSTTTLISSLQRLATRQQRREKVEGQPGLSRESDSGCLTEHDSSETKADDSPATPTKHV